MLRLPRLSRAASFPQSVHRSFPLHAPGAAAAMVALGAAVATYGLCGAKVVAARRWAAETLKPTLEAWWFNWDP